MSARPIVAVVCADKPLADASGGFQALTCEVEGLRAAGAEPVLVVTAPSLTDLRGVAAARRRLIESGARALGAPLAAIVPTNRRPDAWPALVKTALHTAGRRPFGPEQDIDLARLATPPPGFDFGVRPDAVLANNLTSLPAADRLAARERQLVVLHYLPARWPAPRFLTALAGRPSLLALGQDDAAALRRLLPEAHVHAGLQVRPADFRHDEGLPVFSNLAAALAASGAALAPRGGWTSGDWARRSAADLLFVGDAHPANVAGLAAFVQDCFLPRLAPQGISLMVAGAVGPALGGLLEHPAIAVTGYCRALQPLYAASRLVVVPILEGDGVATKTVEAVAMGMPVLATAAGLRGLGEVGAFAMPDRFDERWDARIQELLADGETRRVVARALAGTISGPSIAAVIAHVLGPLLAGQGAPPLPPRPLIAECREVGVP